MIDMRPTLEEAITDVGSLCGIIVGFEMGDNQFDPKVVSLAQKYAFNIDGFWDENILSQIRELNALKDTIAKYPIQK